MEKTPKELAAKIHKIYPNTIERVKAAVNIASLKMLSIVRNEYITNSTTGSTLKNRSGNLKRGVAIIQPNVKGDFVEGGITFGSIYSSIHVSKERGRVTTIHGKSWLTIPMTWIPESKAVLEAAGGVLREKSTFKNTFIGKSASGNLIIFGQGSYARGKNAGKGKGAIVPLFLLRKSVKVPSRISTDELIARVKPKLQSTLNEMRKLPI